MLKIPTKTYSSYIQNITLDGLAYRIRLRWNGRAESWYIDFYKQDGTVIVYGKRLAINWEIIGKLASVDLPPGKLMVVDNTGLGLEIGRDDLTNGNVSLVYIQESEL